MLAALRRIGLAVIETDEQVPWIALTDEPATRAALARAGLAVKEVPVLGPAVVPGTAGLPSASSRGTSVPGAARLVRMSVPLSVRRHDAVMAALAGAADLVSRGAAGLVSRDAADLVSRGAADLVSRGAAGLVSRDAADLVPRGSVDLVSRGAADRVSRDAAD